MHAPMLTWGLVGWNLQSQVNGLSGLEARLRQGLWCLHLPVRVGTGRQAWAAWAVLLS